MKNIISFICGVLIWIIVCWVTTYYLILFIEKNNNFQPEWCNCSSPDYAQIKMQDIIIEGESTDFEITIMKDKWWMSSYTGSILIIITDEDWETLKDSEYFITQHWLYTFTWSDLWTKRFEKWLTINKKGKYYIEIFDLNANKIWSFPITVINNDISTAKNNWKNNWNNNLAHISEIEILDSEQNTQWDTDNIDDIVPVNFEDHEYSTNETSKNFESHISPDSAEIKVKDPIIVWEATNLKVTILKNGSKMTSYNGTIRIIVTDEDRNKLKDNEYTVPSFWLYKYLWSDLWEKEFQRWLEIKKEGTFYIEVQDLNENEDRTLWRQLITVVNPHKN